MTQSTTFHVYRIQEYASGSIEVIRYESPVTANNRNMIECSLFTITVGAAGDVNFSIEPTHLTWNEIQDYDIFTKGQILEIVSTELNTVKTQIKEFFTPLHDIKEVDDDQEIENMDQGKETSPPQSNQGTGVQSTKH